MFIFGLIIGLIVGAGGTGFAAYRLYFSKRTAKVIEILKGPGTEKEKTKKIAELFRIPTSISL